MRVTVLAIGHRMPAWIQEGWNEYVRRMPPEIRIELAELKPEDRSAGRPVERAKQVEGERVLATLPADATLLALDERGKAVSTQGLAVMLSEWMRDGSHPVFAIGGADGHTDAVRGRARKLVSFGRLTIAHRLVRVLVLEQPYRGFKILRGEPYHRD